jgi:hypothetical protein
VCGGELSHSKRVGVCLMSAPHVSHLLSSACLCAQLCAPRHRATTATRHQSAMLERSALWDTPALVARWRLSRAPVVGTFVPRGAPAVPRPPVRLATTARQQTQAAILAAPVQGRAVAPRGPTALRAAATPLACCAIRGTGVVADLLCGCVLSRTAWGDLVYSDAGTFLHDCRAGYCGSTQCVSHLCTPCLYSSLVFLFDIFMVCCARDAARLCA